MGHRVPRPCTLPYWHQAPRTSCRRAHTWSAGAAAPRFKLCNSPSTSVTLVALIRPWGLAQPHLHAHCRQDPQVFVNQNTSTASILRTHLVGGAIAAAGAQRQPLGVAALVDALRAVRPRRAGIPAPAATGRVTLEQNVKPNDCMLDAACRNRQAEVQAVSCCVQVDKRKKKGKQQRTRS